MNGPNGFGVGGFGFSHGRRTTDLAWAAMAGVSYAITPNLKLELAYRYLDMGDIKTGPIVCQNTPACGNEVQKIHLASQDVKLGMRWMFTDIVAPPAGLLPAAARPQGLISNLVSTNVICKQRGLRPAFFLCVTVVHRIWSDSLLKA